MIDEESRATQIVARRHQRRCYVRSPLTCEADARHLPHVLWPAPGHRRAGRHRRRGRHHRRAVHRRAGHAADHAYVPHRRCRRRWTSRRVCRASRSCSRRACPRARRSSRDRRRGRARAATRTTRVKVTSAARSTHDEYDLPTGYELLVDEGEVVEVEQVVGRRRGRGTAVAERRAADRGPINERRRRAWSIRSEEREEREYPVPASAR